MYTVLTGPPAWSKPLTARKVTVPVGVAEFGSISTGWSGGQLVIRGGVLSTVEKRFMDLKKL